MIADNKNLIRVLKSGGIAVIPTDTLYGISALALSEKAIEKVYAVKKRASGKPMIVLISDIADLEMFKIRIDKKTKEIFEKIWPGKVSVILPCPDPEFRYLHRGTGFLAFRLPAKQDLRYLIETTGPLVSTTVNPEGLLPAFTIPEARNYFGDLIDIYVNEGRIESQHSTLIKITDGEIEVLRQGEVKV